MKTLVATPVLGEPIAAEWRAWGPYLSERQWGTVREDYSESGTAWDYFPHDQARSRAYRWGEDGLLGISDEKQRLCFALALWNGADPILKERLFGLTGSEGNHGEDVKEYYWYLDATPTHSYLRGLYKYPQRAFPVCRPRRGEPAARTGATGVRADRHRRLRRGSLLRRRGGVRQGRSERPPDPDHGDQSRAGPRAAAPAADSLVPQHLVLGPRRSPARAASGARRGAARTGTRPVAASSCRPATTSSATTGSLARETRTCCSRRTKATPSGSGARPTARPTSRTGSTRRSSQGAAEAVNPAGVGTKVAAHYLLRDRAGRDRDGPACACRASATPRRSPTPSRSSPTGSPRPMRFYAALARGPADRGRGAGPAPGAGRSDLEQAGFQLRRRAMARRRSGRSAAA